MQVYNYPEADPVPSQLTAEPFIIHSDGCFGQLPSAPDIVVTQGSDLSFRFCAEQRGDNRPTVACISKASILVTDKFCVEVGDIVELTCMADCSVTGQAQQEVTAISADGLRLTVTPGFPKLTKEVCFIQTELAEGCLGATQAAPAPRLTVLSQSYTVSGVVSNRISGGCVKTIGFTTTAGSTTIKTVLLDSVVPDDHISVCAAGISDAIVQSVTRSWNAELKMYVDAIVLNQSAKTTGCFPGMVADGLLLSFGVEEDGPCSILTLPASVTVRLKPPFGAEVPATADPTTFLGFVSFFAQTVTQNAAGVLRVRTEEIFSSMLVLRSNATGSNRLNQQV
jgi:hypothetical protein